jgi:flavorubredoxin
MPIELYNQRDHKCLMFTDLCHEGGTAVQSNQFLIVDDNTGAIIDPGGNLAYSDLYLAVTQHFPPQQLAAILASHADPDIIASLDRWLTATSSAKVYISRTWERFIPHICKPGKTAGRIVGIPDAGERIPLGHREILALPAHFLHAEGNFQFYDPPSRILFSGDLGASMLSAEESMHVVTSLAPHVRHMEAFHRRYMASNKVMRHWAQMVRRLPIAMIAPQHGAPMAGDAVGQFIDWAEQLPCGIDLLGDRDYTIPTALHHPQ